MWAALDGTPQNRVRDRRFWVLLSTTFFAGMAMALYNGVISNYALQELQVGAARFGLLVGIREIPGLLTVGLAAMAVRFREEYAFAAWALLLGAGLWLHAWAGGFGQLILVTLLFSTGLHLWYISRDVLVVDVAAPQERALRFGQLASAGAAASMIGMGLISLLGRQWPLHRFFLAGGLLGMGAGALGLLLRTSGKGVPQRERFVWRWQYRPLYVLTLLVAAREMITLTLASYLLVEVHQFKVERIAMLAIVQGLLSVVLKPLAGKLTDRLGDQQAMVWNFGLVVCLFLGYACVSNPWVLAGIYVADNVLVGFTDIALSTYAARIVPRQELGATLSMCSTLSHAVAVPLPIVSALLWRYGTVVPFLPGVAVAAVALIYAERRRRLTIGTDTHE